MDNLRKGDIVLNGYAGPENDLFIIVGSTTRKTGPYSTTTYYACRALFRGKLATSKSLFNKRDNKLTKIGYYDMDTPVKEAMAEAKRLAQL